MRLLLALALLLLAAPPAGAAVRVQVALGPEPVSLGEPTSVTGAVQVDGVPAAGAAVRLEGRRHPFDGAVRVLGRTTTGDDGSFAFSRRLDRNWKLRVVREEGGRSPWLRAVVHPRFTLAFRDRSSREIVLIARYRVPRGVKLTRRTRFYVGAVRARRGRLAAIADVRRRRAGRYRASAVVELPRRWKGRFRYGACLPYSPGSGMGEPGSRCPRRLRLR